MKIAVLLSGQPRNVIECYNNIQKNVISPNNADVFVHTWVDPGMVGKRYTANWVKKEKVITQKDDPEKYSDIASNPVPANIDKVIYHLYQPKKWWFEKPRTFDIDKNVWYTNRAESYMHPQDVCSFQYSNYAVNVLKQLYENENSFEYDIVMRLRFDNIFNTEVDLKNFYHKNIIFIPNDFPNDVGISDRWAICNSKLMNTYTKSYLYLEEMLQENIYLYVQNEMLIGTWVRVKNQIQVEPTPISYYIKRK